MPTAAGIRNDYAAMVRRRGAKVILLRTVVMPYDPNTQTVPPPREDRFDVWALELQGGEDQLRGGVMVARRAGFSIPALELEREGDLVVPDTDDRIETPARIYAISRVLTRKDQGVPFAYFCETAT